MNKSKLWFVLATTFLNAIGLTLILPGVPFLVGKFTPEAVAFNVSLLFSIYAVCQFFAAPVLGALSDCYGRRPILLLSLFGSAVGYLILGVGGSIWMLFLGRIVDGLTAGNISTLYASIADSADSELLGKYYGYLGAAHGIGFMLGPAIGGLIGRENLVLPFYLAAVITFIALIWGFIAFPETLATDKRQPRFGWSQLNAFGHFKQIFILKEARLILLVGFCYFFGIVIYQSNLSVYLKDVFDWSPSGIGAILFVVGAIDVVSRAYLLPKLLPRFGDLRLNRISLIIGAVGLVIIAVTGNFTSAVLIFASVIIITTGDGFFDPTYNSLLSQSVDESRQGQIQGANQSMQAVCYVFAPIAAAFVYYYHQASVYLVAAVFLISALFFIKRQLTEQN